ncbi:MAG: translocation/assembly module TamB domain-containing protein [Legionellaceae bacterium]|nr:translocation/assembly module TamB domain-containing protein [Legionellaceae bacterium]
MKIIRALLYHVAFLLILLIGMLCFLLGTTPGAQYMFKLSHKLLPGTLNVEHVDGHVWQDLSLKNLSYVEKNRTIKLNHAQLSWHLKSLIPLHITLDKLDLNQLSVVEDETEQSLEAFTLQGAWINKSLALTGHTEIALPQGLLKVNIFTNGLIITSQFSLGENHVTLKGPFKGPWTLHAKLEELKKLEPSLAPLKSTLIADATVYDMKHATLKAHLTPGVYQLPEGSTPESIAFRYAAVNLNLTPKKLDIDGNWQINQHITGNLKFELPGIRLNQAPKPEQIITGEAHLDVASFDFLNQIIKLSEDGTLIQNLAGKIHAVLHITGELNQPKLESNITLSQARVTLPELGITLNPIEITAKSDAKNWEAHGKLHSNNSPPLTLEGQGTLEPALTGSASLQGENIIIMATPEYGLKASPNLTLTLKPDAYDIRGRVLIPQALISPVTFYHTKKLSHDVVFAHQKQNPNPFNLTTHVLLDMGDDVRVNAKGIQGLIDGQLDFKQEPQQPLTAAGTLKLRDGRYEAYGQKLKIERGALIFFGQQIDNPNLSIRAVRYFNQANAQFEGSNELFDFSESNLDSQNLGNQTTVGITVSGRVDAPRVKLFSKPPNLSEANKLSMLLLGKPADQASKSGGAILIQAMKSMHLDSGSKSVKMLQDLKNSAGIDFDVRNSSLGTRSSDVSKTSVMVGKSITKRIYLRYNVGLFQENSNVLTLTYLLNKFLNAKVTASDVGNGIDFTYSRSD